MIPWIGISEAGTVIRANGLQCCALELRLDPQ